MVFLGLANLPLATIHKENCPSPAPVFTDTVIAQRLFTPSPGEL